MSKAPSPTSDSQVEMNMQEQQRINVAFEARQEEVLALLSKRRTADAKARSLLERAQLAFARAEEALARLYQRKTYEITMDPEWEAASVDPRSGAKSEGWAEIVIEHLVSEDADWLAAKKTYYDAQELASSARQDAIAVQAEIASLHEEIGVLKNRAIMRAALLFASRPMFIDMGDGHDQLSEGVPPGASSQKGANS